MVPVADPGFQKGSFHSNTEAYSQSLPDSSGLSNFHNPVLWVFNIIDKIDILMQKKISAIRESKQSKEMAIRLK